MKKLLVILPSLILVWSCYSQRQIDITIGAGYTALDLDALIEADEVSGTFATDWDQTSFGFSAQYFFLPTEAFQFGIEAMYQHLYWYSVRVPFGSQVINREYYITTTRITPVFRFGAENFAFDVGPEFNFSNDLELGLMLSGNKYIPISDKIDFSIKGRLDIINGIVITVPVTLHAGVRIKL